MKVVFIAIACVLLLAGSAVAQKIEGVWQVTEAGIGGDHPMSQKATQPSQYIFTKKHYSIMQVLGDTPRLEIDERSPATPEQIKETFVNRFVANGGTYELKNGKLTTWPSIAKSPLGMKSGMSRTSTIEIEGKEMTMSTTYEGQGIAKVIVITKLVRIE